MRTSRAPSSAGIGAANRVLAWLPISSGRGQTVYGDYLQPDLVSQVIVRRLKKAGIGASMHSLQHSHATNLLSRGVPLPAVSARLGHADVNITARIYAHALPDDNRRAADTWDSVVAGDGGVAGDGAVTDTVQ